MAGIQHTMLQNIFRIAVKTSSDIQMTDCQLFEIYPYLPVD